MELKRHLDTKFLLIGIYILAFEVYIVIGLNPASAKYYQVDGNLSIPELGLYSDVTTLSLNGNNLDTPDTIVGSFSNHDNKTLLIGHSTTVFTDLYKVSLGDMVEYNGKSYKIEKIETLEKAQVDMDSILSESRTDTIVIMTCAGELLEHGDATHRLIVTATLV